MNEFEQPVFIDPDQKDSPEASENYRALDEEKKAGEQGFTPEEMRIIESKRSILSSLAFFIGKDFQMPVELNQPGAGWHWDFKANVVRVDPVDLLNKPMDYLRFVISHEGGHRRVSRTEFIPQETWRQPGFSFLMNAIEDPRDNNFVAENYPKFREQMDLAYNMDLDLENKSKEKAKEKLGYQPRFMQAGFEYIKQWFLEQKGEESSISELLPDEVKEVVAKTLESARASWWTYPSRVEADQDEEFIKRYAEASYKINLEKIWPEFQKLVEKDMEDQKTQELLDDMQQEQGEGGGNGLPQELKDKLTPEEQKELEEAIDKAIEDAKSKQEQESQQGQQGQEGQGEEPGDAQGEPEEGAGQKGRPIDLDSLSPELKQKIKEYIDSLPEDKKEELKQRARKAISDFEKELDEEIEGKMSENPDKKSEDESENSELSEQEDSPEVSTIPQQAPSPELEKYREMIAESLKKDENVYEEQRREVLDVINSLENDLREIFVARRMHAWKGGFKAGKRIDIKRRIQEKAKEVSAMESRAWEKRELPSEKDYAISLLVDLSGSMQGKKIEETFKAVIVLAEVLNRFSIQTEILGFNDRIYEYQKFGEAITRQIRENMGGMLREVNDTSGTGRARWNDDGWALTQTSERLGKQKAKEKFIIVLSDGDPVESPMHPEENYGLSDIVSKILRDTDQKLIGLGIGPGTKHVEHYYPNSLADVNVDEMAGKLADLIREAIANYDNF